MNSSFTDVKHQIHSMKGIYKDSGMVKTMSTERLSVAHTAYGCH
jgi:hypothetical protein